MHLLPSNRLLSLISGLLFLFCSLNTTAQVYTTVTVSVQEADCPNTLGSITLTPLLTGTYSYVWNTGATTASITNLSMGKYTCTVTVDGGTPEVITASTYRSWDIGRLVPTDTNLSIVGNAVTVDPNLPYLSIADQRLHVYDKTPIDIENATGSIFAKFTNNHPDFPSQVYDPTKPPVFYIELLETSALDIRELHSNFVLHHAFGMLVGGRFPEKIYAAKNRQIFGAHNYTGYDYTAGDELEVRFLGSHQLEVYLEGVLIHSTTLPQRASNEYIIAIGFNDKSTLDRRVAYDLKSSFCSTMPLVKKVVEHSQKYANNGSIALELIEPDYLSSTYTYQWDNGATSSQRSGLSKATYMTTITNGTGVTKTISTTIEDKLLLQANTPATTRVDISENSLTIHPDTSQNLIYDYRNFGYDAELIVQASPAQPKSIKWWVSADHSSFPNQQVSTNNTNAVFYMALQPLSQATSSSTTVLDLPFKVAINAEGKFYWIDRVGWIQTGDWVATNIRHHREGMPMEWRFIGNRQVELYINDLLVATKTIPGTEEEFYWTAGFNDNSIFDRRIVHDVRSDFESQPPIVYANLKEQVDASFHPLIGSDDLYFIYEEKYKAGNLSFQVFDQNRVAIGTAAIEHIDVGVGNTKNYGINYYKLTLPTMTVGQLYLLEVTNEKNEKQYLRFSKI